MIDTDPQCNLSLVADAYTTTGGVYAAMKGKNIKDLIKGTATGDILPATMDLIGVDSEFTQTGREYLLKEALEPITDEYSHIIIDSPPNMGIMAINALAASTDVIIPLSADIYSIQALAQVYDTIGKVKKYCNHDLKIAGLLLTRHNNRTILSRELQEAIQDRATALNTKVFNSSIREGIAIKEAALQKTDIFTSHRQAKVTQDYSLFIKEYLDQEE
jgi:chromosome partitioning protein